MTFLGYYTYLPLSALSTVFDQGGRTNADVFAIVDLLPDFGFASRDIASLIILGIWPALVTFSLLFIEPFILKEEYSLDCCLILLLIPLYLATLEKKGGEGILGCFFLDGAWRVIILQFGLARIGPIVKNLFDLLTHTLIVITVF